MYNLFDKLVVMFSVVLSEDEEDWDHEATPPPAPERVSPLPRLEAPSVPVLYPHRAQDDYREKYCLPLCTVINTGTKYLIVCGPSAAVLSTKL